MFGALTRNVGAVAVARLATTAGSVGANILVAWMLSRDSAGLFQKAVVALQMAVQAGAFGIQTSLYYFLPRVTEDGKRGLIGQSLAVLSLIGLVVCVLLFACAGRLALWMNDPLLEPLLRAAAFAVLLSLPAVVSDPIFIAHDRARRAAAVAIASSMAQLALTAYALWMHMPLEWLFGAMAVAALIRLLPALGFASRAFAQGSWLGWRRQLFLQQAAYILPVGITSVFDTLSSWLDRTLVSHYYDAASFATYAYGAIEVPFIPMLIGAVTPVLLPRFSAMLKDGGGRAGVLDLWHRAAFKAAIILLPMFFVFMWTAPDFLTVLYSPKYRDSAPYFRIYLVLLPVRIVAFMPLLFALGRAKYVMAGAAGEVCLNLAASLFLMRVAGLGMAGAACGTVVSTLCQVAFYLWGIRHSLDVPWRAILPWRALGAEFATSGVLLLPLAFLLFLRAPPAAPVAALWRLAVAAVCFCVYAWFRILPRIRAAINV
ncbi:MAG: oligosaccharide flippase family protein [bacterium]|nr:oligosaccharide flippase family protein [Candidatus Sumerlaeota bacterium]